MKTLGKKKAAVILRRLKEIRKIATMKTASFYLDKEKADWLKMGNEEDTNKIRKATELWRESWILMPLDKIINEIEDTYFSKEI